MHLCDSQLSVGKKCSFHRKIQYIVQSFYTEQAHSAIFQCNRNGLRIPVWGSGSFCRIRIQVQHFPSPYKIFLFEISMQNNFKMVCFPPEYEIHMFSYTEPRMKIGGFASELIMVGSEMY
jgi:hypothetical protein